MAAWKTSIGLDIPRNVFWQHCRYMAVIVSNEDTLKDFMNRNKIKGIICRPNATKAIKTAQYKDHNKKRWLRRLQECTEDEFIESF